MTTDAALQIALQLGVGLALGAERRELRLQALALRLHPRQLLLELLQLLLRGQPLADSLRPSYAFVAERGAPVGGPLSRGHRRPWRGYLNGRCRYGNVSNIAVSALATISSAMAANASSSQLRTFNWTRGHAMLRCDGLLRSGRLCRWRTIAALTDGHPRAGARQHEQGGQCGRGHWCSGVGATRGEHKGHTLRAHVRRAMSRSGSRLRAAR